MESINRDPEKMAEDYLALYELAEKRISENERLIGYVESLMSDLKKTKGELMFLSGEIISDEGRALH